MLYSTIENWIVINENTYILHSDGELKKIEKTQLGALALDEIEVFDKECYMKQVKDLVPKNKFDFSGIEELRKLSDKEIVSVIPDLLEWMKDMNWPVAKEMPALLVLHQKALIPHIIEILQPEQSESDWKTYIIQDLLPLLDEKYLTMIKPSLERIVKNPTLGELDEKTNVAAADILK